MRSARCSPTLYLEAPDSRTQHVHLHPGLQKTQLYIYIYLKAALWAPTFWAVSFCHFSPWIYPSRKNKYGCTCHFNIASPTGTPQEQNSLHKIRLHNWKPKKTKKKKKKQRFQRKVGGLIVAVSFFLLFFFGFFGFCVFLVVLLIVPPVYRGGFTLKMFSPLLPVSPSILSHTLSLGVSGRLLLKEMLHTFETNIVCNCIYIYIYIVNNIMQWIMLFENYIVFSKWMIFSWNR